jgi:hypothetical protein
MSYVLSSEKAFGNLLKGNLWKKVHCVYKSAVICRDFCNAGTVPDFEDIIVNSRSLVPVDLKNS